METLRVEGYRVATSFSRTLRRHGGVLVLVREQIECDEIFIKQFSQEVNCEVCGIYLKRYNVSLLCLYRCPSANVNSMYPVLDNVMNSAKLANGRALVCGDFNVNF